MCQRVAGLESKSVSSSEPKNILKNNYKYISTPLERKSGHNQCCNLQAYKNSNAKF
jgi:hypothetical protein